MFCGSIYYEYSTMHEEAFDRLCFVCGEIIPEGKRKYDVETNQTELGTALKCPGLFTIPDVTPAHYCLKCHVTTRTHLLNRSVCVSVCPSVRVSL